LEPYGDGGAGCDAESELVGLDDLEVAGGVGVGFGVLVGQSGTGHVGDELGDVGKDFGNDAGFDVEGGFVEDRGDSAGVEFKAEFETNAENALEDDAIRYDGDGEELELAAGTIRV
jgi:hypothetical protein